MVSLSLCLIKNHMKMYVGVKVQLLMFVGILYKMEKDLYVETCACIVL